MKNTFHTAICVCALLATNCLCVKSSAEMGINMDLKETKTWKNIQSAFASESIARNKYIFYAAEARTAGQNKAAQLFEQMAENEREHARIWFEYLTEKERSTEDNLREAADGENKEWKVMYPGFADVAREEGLDMIAVLFEKIVSIENDHEKKFREMLMALATEGFTDVEAVEPNAEQEKEEVIEVDREGKQYRCIICGDLEEECLEVCPLCGSFASFVEIDL